MRLVTGLNWFKVADLRAVFCGLNRESSRRSKYENKQLDFGERVGKKLMLLPLKFNRCPCNGATSREPQTRRYCLEKSVFFLFMTALHN